MSTSPAPRPHRRVRSVPIQLNFQITPVTTRRSKLAFAPTSGTATPSSNDTPNDVVTRKRHHSRRGSRSSGTHSPHSTAAAAYEDHPSIEIKRSSSTFFLSSLPSYRHDWTYRQGARVAAESLEEQGRSWLVSRASSTDLAGQKHLADDEDIEEDDDGIYHRHTRDLEILDIGETIHEETREEEDGEFNWTRWIGTFMDFGEETDDEVEWKPPRRRIVAFVDRPGEDIDEGVVQRARERDEEHGMDGWMDGAAYLAFLGVRALGGFF
jgi:hypothetical protein